MALTQAESKRQKYSRRQSSAKGRDIATRREDIPELLRLTYDENPKTRCAAVQYLCPCHVQMNKPEVWNRLLELARDPELEMRRTVFHILGDGSPNERAPEIAAAFESMYHDPDPKLRRRARQFLAQYRRTGRINVL